MIDLKALPHTETLVPITITRLGEERATRYQISQSEAKQPPQFSYAARADQLTQEYIRSKYGDHDRDQTQE
jgi:hypothetical protein